VGRHQQGRGHAESRRAVNEKISEIQKISEIFCNATSLARQAQMKAAQSVNDSSLLQTGVYYTINPPPTPVP
jgi:hypothetical protein